MHTYASKNCGEGRMYVFISINAAEMPLETSYMIGVILGSHIMCVSQVDWKSYFSNRIRKCILIMVSCSFFIMRTGNTWKLPIFRTRMCDIYPLEILKQLCGTVP